MSAGLCIHSHWKHIDGFLALRRGTGDAGGRLLRIRSGLIATGRGGARSGHEPDPGAGRRTGNARPAARRGQCGTGSIAGTLRGAHGRSGGRQHRAGRSGVLDGLARWPHLDVSIAREPALVGRRAVGRGAVRCGARCGPGHGSQAPYAALLQDLVGARAANTRTITLELARPMPHLPAVLALPVAAPQRPVSAAGNAVIGNGPYRLLSRRPGERIELERNPHYHGASYRRDRTRDVPDARRSQHRVESLSRGRSRRHQ